MSFFYIACGKADGLFAASSTLSASPDEHQVRHVFVASVEGHVWRIWRNNLADFATRIFK